MVTAPEQVLWEGPADRWRRYDLAPEQIAAKVEENDLPNGRLVVTQSAEPEFVIDFEF